MSWQWVKIAEFPTEFEANLAKAKLDEAGVEAVLLGENLINAFPCAGLAAIELRVVEGDKQHALDILNETFGQEDN
ncbi:MAG: DUF2007 domain-containing protein [Planctomycetota bacterium]